MNFYCKRILMTVPTLLGISIITFVLLQALPGDPVQGLAGDRADPEVLERIRQDMGTDRSIALQYTGYLKLLLQGELGRSFYTNRSVLGDIARKLPNTIMLAAAAMLFSTCFGILLGIFMAVQRGTVWDRLALMLSTGGISLPVFWLGLLLIYLFSFKIQLFPPAGMGSGFKGLLFLALPAATLGLSSAAALARITRTSMLEVLSQPYITTARAKGLSSRVVIFKHAFKNTLIPVVTLIGLDFGSYLNGSILTETIFGWDGIGRYAVEGIFQRDYPVIMGCVLTGALLFVLVNLAVDLLYGLLDPRISHAPAESQP
jgi:ABC-type dipeptide/oligopeptide/nickel transport system permease component